MSTLEPREAIKPLTRFPYRSRAANDLEYAPGNLWLGPFGLHEKDLKIDFGQPLRPFLVTDILDCCAKDERNGSVDSKLFWNLTVGTRIECLLLILSCSGVTSFPIQFRCPGIGCEQESEVEISVSELSEIQERAYEAERLALTCGSATLALRRPTGADQLAWLNSSFASEENALATMLRTLLLDTTNIAPDTKMSRDLIEIAGQAMEEFDPLVSFSLTVQCPFCAEESRCEIDLEELSIRILRNAQRRLLKAVHRLAIHYHWSEPQIFSLPYWRRAHYLALIEAEARKK